MEKYEDDIHNCTNERLTQLLREIGRRHVDQDRAIIYEAATRIEARKFQPIIPFNHEAFE